MTAEHYIFSCVHIFTIGHTHVPCLYYSNPNLNFTTTDRRVKCKYLNDATSHIQNWAWEGRDSLTLVSGFSKLWSYLHMLNLNEHFKKYIRTQFWFRIRELLSSATLTHLRNPIPITSINTEWCRRKISLRASERTVLLDINGIYAEVKERKKMKEKVQEKCTGQHSHYFCNLSTLLQISLIMRRS